MSFKQKWKNPTGTRTYFAWRSMRNRCSNPRYPSYIHYGGRGISVCKRWSSYDAFFEDMGEAPVGMSLDRINNNKGYSPANCRWATIDEQLNNQRRNIRLTKNGKTQTASQWAKELGLRASTLFKRLERMPEETALTPGMLRTWRHGTRAGYEGHGCRCELCRQANAERHRLQRQKRKERAR